MDRLSSLDSIYVRKLSDTEVLLQIFETGYGEEEYADDEYPPQMFVEAVVGYKRLVWEVYTSFVNLPNVAHSRLRKELMEGFHIPNVEAWLGLKHDGNWQSHADDIFGEDQTDSPWKR